MSNAPQPTNAPPEKPKSAAGKLLVVVALLTLGSLIVKQLARGPAGGVTAPVPMPALLVEGWINAEGGGPTRESLAGRHVVVDAWATWCPPCRASMPALAELRGRWGDRGVAFVGLTSERSTDREKIAAFAETVPGFDWPVGYGAGFLFDQLDIRAIPTMVLFDPTGVSIWRGHSVRDLERELEKRVATGAPDGAT